MQNLGIFPEPWMCLFGATVLCLPPPNLCLNLPTPAGLTYKHLAIAAKFNYFNVPVRI